MNSRLITTAALVLTLTGLTAPVVAADTGGPPPVQGSRYDGRSPDTKDAVLAAHRASRTLLSTNSASSWPPPNGIGYDGRSPDTKDAATSAHSSRTRTTAAAPAASFDGRNPDTKDAAAAARAASAPVIVVGSTGFDWTDAGIGAAAGFGLAITLAASLALTRSRTSVITHT